MKPWMFLLTAIFGSHVSLFAQDMGMAASSGQNMTQTFLVFGVGIFLFYFIVFRPESKRRKQLDQQREALKEGDEVVALGIMGKVSQIKEDSVILKLIDGNRIELKKYAISEVAKAEKS